MPRQTRLQTDQRLYHPGSIIELMGADQRGKRQIVNIVPGPVPRPASLARYHLEIPPRLIEPRLAGRPQKARRRLRISYAVARH